MRTGLFPVSPGTGRLVLTDIDGLQVTVLPGKV